MNWALHFPVILLGIGLGVMIWTMTDDTDD